MKSPARSAGFGLIELLVAVAIVGLLAALAVGALRSTRERAQAAKCLQSMKSLGQALRLFAIDNHDEFPRSFHSAASSGQPGWAFSIAPYLGIPESITPNDWTAAFNRHFRCPLDPSKDAYTFSYGLNVFFELDPNAEDYPGRPAQWRKTSQVPRPSRTVLLAESKPTPFADHFMSHQWTSSGAAKNAVASMRHSGRSNYVFVDGRVESLHVGATFDPAAGINLWNPSLSK